MRLPPSSRFQTVCIHAGQEPDPTTGAIITPLYQTATYVQDELGKHKGFEYSRTRNPTRDALQGCLAALEGAKHGLAFASGLAATDAILHLLQAGDHVLYSDDVYGGTFRIFDKVFRRHGLAFDAVDMSDPANVARALRKETRLLWIESPTNPMLKIVDLAEVARIARAHGATTVVDNTFATPWFQRPLELGIDVVMHSATKYLNGHSDMVGGIVVVRDDALAERLAYIQNAAGAVPDLVAALADPAPRVRRDAVRALGQIGLAASTAAAAVEKLLHDPEEIVRQAAKVTLRKIEPRTPAK